MSKWLLLALLTSVALAPVPPVQLPVPPEQCEGPVPLTTAEPVIPAMVYSGGFVVTRVHVAADGAVSQVDVLSPFPALTEPVEAAVRQWRFAPAMCDGKIVAGRAIVAVQVSINRAVIGQGGPAPRR
jgi:hypothetical protein